jgi:hypothetical protein
VHPLDAEVGGKSSISKKTNTSLIKESTSSQI